MYTVMLIYDGCGRMINLQEVVRMECWGEKWVGALKCTGSLMGGAETSVLGWGVGVECKKEDSG